MSLPLNLVSMFLCSSLLACSTSWQTPAMAGDLAVVTAFISDDRESIPPTIQPVSCDVSCRCDDSITAQCCNRECCRRGPKDWFTADYLHWWMEGDHVPALVTSSPLGTDRVDAGVLGLASTTVLYGDERIADGDRPGVRLGLGRWLHDDQETALTAEFFWLVEHDDDFSRFSNGDPALARPFFNTDPAVAAEDAELVAFDDPLLGDELDGRVNVDTESETYSAAVSMQRLLRCRQCGDRGYRMYLQGGYRFFRLNEALSISESLLVTGGGGGAAPGTTIDVFDAFDTRNEFHGGEVGIKTRAFHGAWSLDVLGKVGIGNSHQTTKVNGSTTVTVPTFPPFTSSGGLLAQSTNSGTFENDEFALLPELHLNLRYQINCRAQARIGYSLLFLTESVRPGNAIDRSVDGRFLDPLASPFTATNPVLAVDSTSVWLQGVNLGFELTF